MPRLLKSTLLLISAVVFVVGFEPGVARAQQVVVTPGPLTPDCPFGICPVTNQPRTARDFYQLFGYLPASTGSFPGVPTSPPANWPKTYYTPKPGSVPQTSPPATAKNTPSSRVPPASNTPPSKAPQASNTPSSRVPQGSHTPPSQVPQVSSTPSSRVPPASGTSSASVPSSGVAPSNGGPRTNVMPRQIAKQPAAPASNPRSKKVVSLSAADAQRLTGELNNRNSQLLDKVNQDFVGAVDNAIANLPDSFTPDQKQQIRADILRGDTADASQLLGATSQTEAGRNVLSLGATRRYLDRIGAGIRNGTMTGPDLTNLLTKIDTGLNTRIQPAIGQMAVNQQVINWLTNAVFGPNLIPFGANAPIALIPGMPQGTMIPLGNGATLVGNGGAADQIILGQGNVLQAAGLPAPIGSPVPDFDGPISAGQVILTNAGTEQVNYTVNDSPFSMQPTFKQDLPGGQTWTVEFDRGGARTTPEYQRYDLTEGYYEFTPTPNGWELYKKSFDVSLENANDFDFNYVLDGEQRVLRAGAADGLVGAFPPVIRFDNGSAQFKQKRLMNGTFRVALNPDTTVDVFPADAVPPPPKSEELVISIFGSSNAGGPGGSAAPVSTLSAPAAPIAALASAPPATKTITLPPGFRPLDPVALLTAAADKKLAATPPLPPAFTMFAAADPDKAGGN